MDLWPDKDSSLWYGASWALEPEALLINGDLAWVVNY
jgi:hypothetical protein